jgi:hypothetical protein
MSSSTSQTLATPEEVELHLAQQRASRTAARARSAWSATELIEYAKENPPQPIIDGLVHDGDTFLIHGSEESFKSVFVVQIAESIASGRPLLRHFRCRASWRTGVIETEMHPAMLGERLATMFPGGNAPEKLCFFGEDLLKQWRGQGLDGKFEIISRWVAEHQIEVLVIDTANDFFRGTENPSDERCVGAFFDKLRNLHLRANVLVRHDRKKKDFDAEYHSNELIRGSAEWKEDPEAILHIRRNDKRTHQVTLDVGKLRYGAKPEPLDAWFDLSSMRLTALPPLVAVLEAGQRTRQEVIAECEQRFRIAPRTVDSMIDTNAGYIRLGTEGHNRTLELDPARCLEAPWASFLTHPER